MEGSHRFTHWLSLIHTRLTLWIIAILAAGLLVFILTTLLIAQQILNNSDQKRLQQNMDALSTALMLEPTLNAGQRKSLLNTFSSDEFYLQYQDQQGKPVASSTNLGSRIFPFGHLRSTIASGGRYSLTMDNTVWYLSGRSIIIRGQLQGYLIIARTSVSEETSIFILMYSGACIMLAAIAVLVWLLVRRTLRPLEQLADAASHIAQRRDHALRVAVQGRPDEIQRLSQTINGMLHALEEAYLHVQQVNTLQRRFLADASHELRTPLTIMLSSLELMKKEQGSDLEFQRNALEDIQAEAQRMARLTTRLLMLARTDATAPAVHEPVLIADIISDAYRQSSPACREVSMSCQGIEQLDDAVVSGNADYLKQVLLILLENACKYTLEGGTITLTGERKERMVVISVTDTGIGIPQEDQPRLFERFYRGQNARSKGGMGLGLAIAQGIIEQHSGTIRVESAPGRGSRFAITLPLLNEPECPEEPSQKRGAHDGAAGVASVFDATFM